MRYEFGNYSLDTQRHEFWCGDMRVKLRPKVFQVLTYLIEHRDRVVSKDELLEQLWPDQFIGDGSLNACMMAVRKAVGDSRQNQRYIQTLHSRGYRFIAEVLTPAEAVEESTRADDNLRSCVSCGHVNPSSAAFCNTCGEPLVLHCPGCHADNLLDARFCHICGASIQPHETPASASCAHETAASLTASEAERRQLTVMVCDVVGPLRPTRSGSVSRRGAGVSSVLR
ncbi:hypothetical protein C2W62_26130 [Candidatus Entotheonella serta]|nr:hypothetical protein C2W62_26130 [Candidatus Entotheonella serta]